MDPGLLAAVVTAFLALAATVVASLIAAAASLRTQRGQAENNEQLLRLKDRLDAEKAHHEWQRSARAELDNLREPLLLAARDLQSRIYNIRKNNFYFYIISKDDHRRDVALLGTLYRFARYWAVQELLYSRTNLLRFESDPDTSEVADLVGRLARTFASDSSSGLDLIFWREEQRAVAELMVNFSSDHPMTTFTGFASFSRRYHEDLRREAPEDLALWLERFAQDLRMPTIAENQRLKELDANLGALVETLEKGKKTTDIAPTDSSGNTDSQQRPNVTKWPSYGDEHGTRRHRTGL
ncbi:hypothetical protein [Arthrobacter sp. NicSoilB11]|uniref:hypothetical protein n=1 Tax=Arthrobacter sp. NicSoilB11 TaxID=2830999 RepID=UPI001CC5F2B4|nr:hypothetical protein [Arthrobacter sp. NicSoilB11]BCW74737.1 hypothetical protein NicSoilB11_10620 [Arthrobacter sp. NicSoilB11]